MKDFRIFFIYNLKMLVVLEAGLEPARFYPTVFETAVSAIPPLEHSREYGRLGLVTEEHTQILLFDS